MHLHLQCENWDLKMSGPFLEKYEIEVEKQVVVGNKRVKGCRELSKR